MTLVPSRNGSERCRGSGQLITQFHGVDPHASSTDW